MGSTQPTANSTVSNLGPLTTTFTAPSRCNSIAAECLSDCSLGWQDQSCGSSGATNAIDCSPATTPGAPTAWVSYAYSPGLYCPAGFTTACLATHGATTSQCTPLPLLQPGETGAVCCRQGFQPPNQQGDACVKYVSAPTTFGAYYCSGALSVLRTIRLPSTNSYSTSRSVSRTGSRKASRSSSSTVTVTTWLISAGGVQLRWQSTDRPALPATSVSSGTPSGQPSPNGGGLSTGTQAGIGVGAAVGAFLLIFAAFWFWSRQRKKRRNAKQLAAPTGFEKAELSGQSAQAREPDGHSKRHVRRSAEIHELETVNGSAELQGD